MEVGQRWNQLKNKLQLGLFAASKTTPTLAIFCLMRTLFNTILQFCFELGV